MALGAVISGGLTFWAVTLLLLVEGSLGMSSAGVTGLGAGLAMTAALIAKGLMCVRLRERHLATGRWDEAGRMAVLPAEYQPCQSRGSAAGSRQGGGRHD